MPNRWESSKRPLFVRTVLVNGNRHAILSQEDPLHQQNIPTSRKQSRPSSGQSFTSTSSNESFQVGKRFKDSKTEWDYDRKSKTKDLQGCLVKLRLVLDTNENLHKRNSEKFQMKQKPPKKLKTKTEKPKRKKSQKIDCICCQHKAEPPTKSKNFKFENINLGYYYLNNDTPSEVSQCDCDNVSDLSRQDSEKSEEPNNSPEKSERKVFVGTYTRPYLPSILGEISDFPWNNVSADSYFTKAVYNPLSERVLQWLDLASKKRMNASEKLNETTDTIERIIEGTTYTDENLLKLKERKMLRSRSEGKIIRSFSNEEDSKKPKKDDKDIEEEVKSEKDVETVLSNDPEPKIYPKYTNELNKLYKKQKSEIVSSRSVNEDSESSLRLVKKINKPGKNKRKSMLQRQTKFQETSDEEEEEVKYRTSSYLSRPGLFCNTLDTNIKTRSEVLKRYKHKLFDDEKDDDSLNNFNDNKMSWLKTFSGKNMWPSDKATSKPQLHIFMPSLTPEIKDGVVEEELPSDCESLVSGLLGSSS